MAACAALAALALAPAARQASGSPYIGVHVSVKVIKNPANGSRPPTANGTALTNADLQDMIGIANDSLLASYWRGYRFVLDPVVDIGWPCASCNLSNPSYWYNQTFAGNTDSLMVALENEAKVNPAYAWSTNAINVYFNLGKGNGAVASFPFPGPGRSRDIVISGSTIFDDPAFRTAFPGAIVHHELGHYFNLKHTSNGQPACSDGTASACSACPGADADSVTDTIEDRSCSFPTCPPAAGWTRDDLAQHNFNLPYVSLNAIQRDSVDDIYENNMSYHNGGLCYGQYILYQLTEGQLDYWTDTANNKRSPVTRGRTWFVSTGGSLGGTGSSTSPFLQPQQGATAANATGGDIVLLRPGLYYQNLTINKPLTLRATRDGSARIGN